MATPRKRQGVAPAPAPAPTPAPAAPKAVAKPAEPKRREEEREEEPKPKRKTGEKREEKPKTPSAPVAGAVTTSTPPYAPDAGTVETPDTEMIGRSGPLSFLGVGRPIYAFTEPSAAETAELESLKPYLTALDRVEELRRQGKIGVQTREVGVGGVTRRSLYRPAVRPERVMPKVDRGPLFRLPPASMMLPNVRRQYDSPEMPTAEELANPEATARKMQEIVRDRDELLRTRLANVRRVKELQSILRRAQQATALGLPTSAAEADIHAGLKDLAAQQRGLSERIAAKESTLREYGMTDKEIEPE